MQHKPVLLSEAIAGLAIKKDGIYIDGTFGRGGHARALLHELGVYGRLIAIDKDPQAILVAKQLFASDERVTIKHASFAALNAVVAELGLQEKIDGILLDLGVSSPQLDDANRGFSFLNDGPLDMRMNPEHGLSASAWLARVEVGVLTQVLRDYGEERFAKRIAQAIVTARAETAITRTHQLAEIVKAANPKWEKHKHPATRTFQAIRIFINNELGDLQQVLADALTVLRPGGRLVVISFHSLEDRMVKQFMRKHSSTAHIPANLPLTDAEIERPLRLVAKAIKAGDEELQHNIRARSAVLRIGEKR